MIIKQKLPNGTIVPRSMVTPAKVRAGEVTLGDAAAIDMVADETGGGYVLNMTLPDQHVDPATAAPLAAGTAAVGTSDKYAREDHVHPAQTVPQAATTAPSALGTAAVGTSAAYARADHVHALPTIPAASTATPAALGTAAVGTSAAYARADHVHALPSIPDGVPVTTMILVIGTTAPTKYLALNGAKVSRTTYKDLFDKWGTKYGAGDGSTTFGIPNMLDLFGYSDVAAGQIPILPCVKAIAG